MNRCSCIDWESGREQDMGKNMNGLERSTHLITHWPLIDRVRYTLFIFYRSHMLSMYIVQIQLNVYSDTIIIIIFKRHRKHSLFIFAAQSIYVIVVVVAVEIPLFTIYLFQSD